MCGITGKLTFSNKTPPTQSVLKSMTDAIAHRGPDDEGFYIKGPVGLGNRRLAIIDLTTAGHQPISNEDKTIWVVFNGEIYNFQDLTKKLKKQGHRFTSHTDTECLAHLYEEYGLSCLEHLRGMFAFAIWDEKKQQLFLARDRLGKKPLKYYIDKEKIVFASELKAILKDPSVPKIPDYEAINHYLSFQYAPTPLTGFKGIKKLPPAHYAIVKTNGELIIKRYWQLDFSKKLEFSETKWQKEILERLEEAVKLRLISDVPLGAFLSGGTDSSAIVALMSKLSNKPVKTFSIGFGEKTFDETPYARIIAKRFKTEHKEFTVKPNAVAVIPELVKAYEEPYADSSALPSWYLAKMTRQHVTVALNGDGGDENFAGYQRYNLLKLLAIGYNFPEAVRKKLISPLAKFLIGFWRNPRQEKASRFFDTLSGNIQTSYFQLVSYFNEQQKQTLYSPNFEKHLSGQNSTQLLLEKFKQLKTGKNLIDQLLAIDIETYLPDDLLVKMDIASMSHSLEVRSPLLDHKFMEFTAQIPSSLKLHGQTNKYIFKKAVGSILPREILERGKMGFGVPIGDWFKKELAGYLREVLLSPKALERGLFKPEEIRRIIEAHQNGKTNYTHHLWALLMLEHWFQIFFD